MTTLEQIQKLDDEFKARFALIEKNYMIDGLITFEEFLDCVVTLQKAYKELKNLIKKGRVY